MSFDVSPIKQPMILSSQRMQNDGGGGNLGYMNQGRKKKEKEKDTNEMFSEKEDTDVIQLNIDDNTKDFNENEETFSASKWFENVAGKIASKLNKKSNNPFQKS